MEIKFKECMPYKSQQSIAIFLKNFNYYFVQATEYDNKNFFCMIKCPEKEIMKDFFYSLIKWTGAKKKTKYFDYRLNLTFCACSTERAEMPMLFTQEDVKNIIADVPENYVGDEIL